MVAFAYGKPHCKKSAQIVECTISSEQTLILLARLRRIKYGRFWLLSGRREIGVEIRELPENTGDLATLFSCETQLILSIDDWVRSLDSGFRTDVAIIDFSKAFDSVPHTRLRVVD